jgi:2-amino-4-hydroxy-6-hydroxymethyldihydropteridine diphosphokinase
MRMFVSLGSNIQPRHYLARAVAELRGRFHLVAVSPVYRTKPAGDPDQPDFFNLAVELESELPPEQVHAALRAIEDLLGRQRDPNRPYGPRTADLDLVLIPGVVGRFGSLELPSPQLAREPFVAVPVADLAADLAHPVLGLTLGEVARVALATAATPPQPIELELP